MVDNTDIPMYLCAPPPGFDQYVELCLSCFINIEDITAFSTTRVASTRHLCLECLSVNPTPILKARVAHDRKEKQTDWASCAEIAVR